MPKVKEVLKTIRKIELKTKRLVEGLMSGSYYSIFKGRGIEFSEVREYVPGDDIRSIDWNVTARFNQPYIKEFVEERDLDIYIVFDKSASNQFGQKRSKNEVGYEIAASIMFSAARNNDNIGLCLFTDKVESFHKPRKGKKQALKLLRDLIYHQPISHQTNINQSINYLNKILKKRSVIILISDLPSNNFIKPLRLLRNKHDVILIKLIDPVEQSIPDIGYTLIEDSETGEQLLINTSDQSFRKNYKTNNQLMNTQLTKVLSKLNIPLIKVNTSLPFHQSLNSFFKHRVGVRA